MAEDQECPEGGHPLRTINATHNYEIHQKDGRSHKTIGSVTYQCETCKATLFVDKIVNVLRQVDEL